MGELEFNGSRFAFEENENFRIHMVLMVAQQCGMYLMIINNNNKMAINERAGAELELLTFSVHSPSDFLPFYALFWL